MTREPRITVDYETRSEIDLRQVGVWRYAEHPTTQILCLSYRFPDGTVGQWRPGLSFPDALAEAAEDDALFEAHNAQFERAIWIEKMAHLARVPRRWADTMAVCGYRALPMSLDESGSVLNIPVQKDKRGKYLLQQLSSPRKPLKVDKKFFTTVLGLDSPDEWPTLWNEDSQLLQELYEYCDQDVASEHCLSETIGDLSAAERRVWILDQKINQRGVRVDMEAVQAAMELTEEAGGELAEQFREATGYEVETVNQNERMKAWLEKRGYPVPNMQKATVESALADDGLPYECYRALELRQKLARASTKKLERIEQWASRDHRVRGMVQYCGAGRTGRFSGRGPQIHNLINSEHDMVALIDAIKSKNRELIDITFDETPNAIAECIRGLFTADDGKDLIVADYSAIEARVLAWLAGEESKLEVFRQGKPVYETTAELIFGYPVNKKDHPRERMTGKVCLGADTQVVTNSGVKAIVDISAADRLWDGHQWVGHEGLVYQGVKNTIEVAGLWATPDHSMLTKTTWQPARELALNESILESALAKGMDGWRRLRMRDQQGMFSFNAIVEGKPTVCRHIICGVEKQPNAIRVLSYLQGKLGKITGAMRTYAPIVSIDGDYSTGLAPPREGVPTQIIAATPTTGAGGYESRLKTSGSFSSTLCHLRGGITLVLKWIGSMLTRTMRRETSGSAVGRLTCLTNVAWSSCKAKSKSSKMRLPVYDLVNAGPNARFTVMTNKGPLIVSNCELALGYGGGLGAWRAFDSSDTHSDEDVEYYKKQWRENHPNIVQLWYGLENAAVNALRLGKPVAYGPVTYHPVKDAAGFWLACRLPSGRDMWYYDPRLEEVESRFGVKMQVSYQGRDNKNNGKWGRVRTYGGKLAENVTQAVARDFMVNGMLNVEKAGYPIIFTVHDEVVAEVDEGSGSVPEFEDIMCQLPDWGHGCPIDADGWRGKRYSK